MTRHTHIIVGAGTAGCVLANRLSADPEFHVLLIEAGRDFAPGSEPAAIMDPFPASYGDPRFLWPLAAEVGADPGTGAPRCVRGYSQGRVIGGCSSIMGMNAQRGLPEDFDEWQRLGAEGWNWNGVLPFYRRLETDTDFNGPLHGTEGPIAIRRHRRADWPPFARAVARAIEGQGYTYQADLSATSDDCLTSIAMNNTPGQRISSATAYLTAKVRSRSNLTIVPDTMAERLIFDGRRAVGVMAHGPEGPRTFAGDSILLCAGGIQSPALLLRSGVGPGEELRRFDIPIVADNAGVGRNLSNHCAIHLAVHLPRHAVQPAALRSWGFSLLRYSSNHAGCHSADMQLFPANRASWHPLGQRLGAVSVCLYKPYSLGSVTLNANDGTVSPKVRFNSLDDPRDLERMIDGVELAARVLLSPDVRAVSNEVFIPPGGQANALNRPTRFNYVKSSLIARLFDGPAWFRSMLIGGNRVDCRELLQDRRAREALVRQTAASVHHVSASCRMGRPADPAAVVDPRCRVRGIQGVRVIDLSIAPTIVRAATHLTALMIGEKAAQMILDEKSGLS